MCRGVRSSLTLALSSDVNKYTFSHSERNPCRVLNIRHGLIISAWTKALDQSEAIISLRWMINEYNTKESVAGLTPYIILFVIRKACDSSTEGGNLFA